MSNDARHQVSLLVAAVLLGLAFSAATLTIKQRALITCASSTAGASQITTAGYGTDRGWPKAFIQERPQRVGSFDTCSFAGVSKHFIVSSALLDFFIWGFASYLVCFALASYGRKYV